MKKRIKAHCVRGLKRFEKSGCPQTEWNELRQEGCLCWATLKTPDIKDPGKMKTQSQCIDLWTNQFAYQQIAMLEGVQIAIESFRNGMVEEDNGEVVPKADRGIQSLLQFIDSKRQLK